MSERRARYNARQYIQVYQREQDLVNQVIEYIQAIGGVAIRINAGTRVIREEGKKARVFRGAPAGTTDIIACVRGQYVGIECKIGNNQPTEKQKQHMEDVREAGGIAFAAWCLDDVMREIDRL